MTHIEISKSRNEVNHRGRKRIMMKFAQVHSTWVIARSKVWREQCWGTAVLHLADLLQLQCPGALGFVVFSNLSRAVKSAFSEAEVPSLWVLPRGKVWREQWWCSALGLFAVNWIRMCQDDTH